MGYSEDLIIKVIGIISTNAFELINHQKPQNPSLPGLFELAALMNHDCIGNTRMVVDSSDNEFKMSVYASVTIPKGTPIIFNYVKPLDMITDRKYSLQTFKFFHCECMRCQDPTELKTFNSAYLCTKCQVGAIVLQNDNCWKCHDCQNVVEDAKIKSLEAEISNGKKRIRGSYFLV